jgi:dGTPase
MNSANISINANINATIAFVKEKDALAEKLNAREFDENNGRAESADRNAYMRDYARVLYCSSFRRLQGKMQLLAVDEARFNRNRLTHSLEVSQIARGLATSLGINDTIIAETCALIHDIGNPPYGHHGEMILNEFTAGCGGYEGNAQAFRVIRVLEKKHPNCDGLNLTVRVLWGITKYFDKRADNPKKFLYDVDYDFLKGQLDQHGITDKKSIDAQIMDLSDEIAYAAHDLEDALSANLIVIGELLHEFSIDAEFKSAGDTLKDIVREVEIYASGANMLGTSEEFSMVFMKELTSRIVNRLVNDIGVVGPTGEEQLGYRTLAGLALGLKRIVFRTVLRKMHIQEYEQRGENVLRGLFEVYSDKSFNKNLTLLPPELRNRKEPPERLICDYLAGMMDAVAAREYIKFFGEAKYNALYR